jgi:dihydrofolate reductase
VVEATTEEAVMGRIVVSSMVSVDGYTEGPGGNVMVMPMDHAFTDHNAERVRAASSLLFGATTYRGMVQFWPTQVGAPGMPESHLYVAQRYADGLPVTVVSDTITEVETGPWRGQTTIVRRADTAAAVARLRAQEGDAVVFGSRTLYAALLADGLVDELHLMVGPKVVAGDHRAFAGVPETDLRLLDVRRFEGSDNVLLSYASR